MNTIKNAIYGYVIGDAYGLSILRYEKENDKIKLQDNKELNIEKGNYSSMTTFMLATLDSITKTKDINTIDILNKMCTSLILGKYTSNGKFYDLDKNTLNILKHYSNKNNLDLDYDELDYSSYALNRVLPLAIFNKYKEDNLDKLVNIISLTNINETVLLGAYIYYKYVYNLLNGYDKYKALYKIEIPDGFDKNIVSKFKNILKGNIYYKEITQDDNIINVLSIVFYVVLNSDNFNDIFMMLNNIEGNTNIYGSLICSIGGIIYSLDNVDKSIYCGIKNKKDINKYIKDFERMLEDGEKR